MQETVKSLSRVTDYIGRVWKEERLGVAREDQTPEWTPQSTAEAPADPGTTTRSAGCPDSPHRKRRTVSH